VAIPSSYIADSAVSGTTALDGAYVNKEVTCFDCAFFSCKLYLFFGGRTAFPADPPACNVAILGGIINENW
jgi:hypothetical protein